MDKYPDIDDPLFQFLVAQRLEFRNLHNNDGLYPHQEFVRRFMSPYTPYKSLVMYHSLGSGKSIACIAVAVDHYLHDGKRCIIVTKGNSGTGNFIKQIEMYSNMCSNKTKWNKSLFEMRHYISLSNQINGMSDNDIKSTFSNIIIILDEVHNVRYLKKVTENSVYGSIVRLLQLCTNVKIIMATATPMTDNPEQINSLLGMCNYTRNNKHSMDGIISYNATIRDKPNSSQMGTDEYIPGMHLWVSEMTGHQRTVYARENKITPPDDIYRELTHISLFCFEDGTHGREITDTKMEKTRLKTTITSVSTKQTKEIKYLKYSIRPEYSHMLTDEYLRSSSSKYSEVINLIENSTGNVFIFLEEVKGSGLLLLASVLEQHGFELYLGEDLNNIPTGRRYTMCVGSTDICPNNGDRLDGFNSDMNKHGDYVRILLGSKVIGESITLKNVRHFYCLTPHWNDSTVDQAIGRVVRNGSHTALEEAYRHVDIYIHAAIFPDDPFSSVDIKKLRKCKEKEIGIHNVAQQMIEKAVDRYCIQQDTYAITNAPEPMYVNNFAAAYLHNHIDYMINYLSELPELLHYGLVDVNMLSDELEIHPTVCKEALCRIISSNSPLTHPIRFLRAYRNCVFTVEDPSLPFVVMPRSREENPPSDELAIRTMYDINEHDVVGIFRYMPLMHKVDFLEYCITNDKHYMLMPINTVYANIDNAIYHLLLYRDLESSYTSANPIPKRPTGKTRMFKNGRWSNVMSVDEERLVFDKYKKLVNDCINDADTRLKPIYGIISTIDGDMRLRLRTTENMNMSASDNRYVRRGRNMKSIKKDYLIEIMNMLGDSTDGSIPINEIVERIDRAIVNSELYIII